MPTIDPILQAELSEITSDFFHINKVLAYSELVSTNEHALLLEKSGQQSGTVVVADKQTGGRGRLDRTWCSVKGDITLSIIIRPPFFPDCLTLLTMMPAVSIVRALFKLGVHAKLKWPNDIIFYKNNAHVQNNYFGNFYKLGGILVENVFHQEKLAASIIGIGINIEHNDTIAENIPHAHSLSAIDKSITRYQFLKKFLKLFDDMIMNAKDQHFSSLIFNDYVSKCETLGKKVCVTLAGKELMGVATKLRDDGSLVIHSHGSDHIVYAGDVLLVR